MRVPVVLLLCLAFLAAGSGCVGTAGTASEKPGTFDVRGVVREVDAADRRLFIEHEPIPGYMEAMTMPFNVGASVEAARWLPGDRIAFKLLVTESDSWIQDLVLLERPVMAVKPAPEPEPRPSTEPEPPMDETVASHPLRSYRFTNELGAGMSLEDLRGRALAITFVFTRCPIPNYCPRLTKNFAEASQILSEEGARGGDTNYHFVSVTMDPEFDTPEVLRSYGTRHGYDPVHWNFWTGAPDRVEAFMIQSGVSKGPDGSVFNHNFRTLIVGPDGRLRASFPMSGNLTDAIVRALREAMESQP